MNLREFFTLNSAWGKLLGFFLGFLIAGPVGALFGIFIGNFFDRGLAQHFSTPYWDYLHEKNPKIRADFIETTYAILGYIAKSDGRVSEREISAIQMLMHQMKLNKKEEINAKKYFSQGKQKNFDLTGTLKKLNDLIESNPNLKRLFIQIQYEIATVDGLTSTKIKSFNVILRHLNIAPLYDKSNFNQNYQNYNYKAQQNHQTYSTIANAYDILRVSPEASQAEVKRAYRRLISQHHPDKLIARGLPEQTIKQANEKTQQIRKAYEQICMSKGW